LIGPEGTTRHAVELPGVPFGLCQLGDGRVAAALKERDALCVVDAERGTVETVPLPAGSMPMGCAAVGAHMFVTLGASSEILEVPIAARLGV
jgi:streptogramin lyase